jgi:mannosyltransferase
MSRVAGDTVAADRRGDKQTDDPSPTADRSDRSARGHRLRHTLDDRVLVAIVAVGAFLRFWGLGSQSLWFDEWLTSESTSGSVVDVLRHVLNREGAAPPYFLGMWVWTQAAGQSALSLRLLPALAGVATIPVMYAAVRTLLDSRRTARVVALLVAVNPMLVWYSQEARPYSLVALAAAVSIWGYARIRTHDGPSQADWLLWGLAGAVAIALHYFAACLVAAEAVALYRQRPDDRRDLRRACIPAGIVIAVLAPFAIVQRSKPGYPGWVEDWPYGERLRNALETAFVGPGAPNARLWWIGLAAAAVAVGLLLWRADRAEREVAGLLAALGAAVVGVAAGGVVVGVDGVLARYLIAGLVPLLAAIGVGLGGRRAGSIGLVAVAGFTAVSLYTIGSVATDPYLQKPDWAGIADVVETPLADAANDDGGTRVLVLSRHGYQAQPLLDLVDDSRKMKKPGAKDVVEIDVLWSKAFDRPCDFLVGRACGLLFIGAPLPQPVAADAVLVERVELDQFVIERYRTTEPLDLHTDDLVRPQDTTGMVYIFG